MSQFFVSILIILSGGFLSLALAKQTKSARIISVFLISLGCLWGLINTTLNLIHSVNDERIFEYLNVFSLSFKIDGLSAFFLFSVFLVCLLSSIYSYHYLDHEKKPLRVAVNYFFFSILISSMALVITASNIIAFMLSWETMSISSFFLVIYNYEASENRKAGYLYFVFSHVGAMFILAAFALIYAHTGNLAFAPMAGVPDALKILIFIFSFIGFGSKAGVFPFHVWLPFAHPAAPSHISAVMSGVMIKTGIYGIIRIYILLDLHTPLPGMVMIIAGAVSGILGVVYALGQHDLKRLLAYSSVENIGIILTGLGIGMMGVSSNNPAMAILGFTGGFFHILNHAVFKSLLFMGAGMVLHAAGTRSMDALGGLLKRMKITGICVIIGSLAISGLPPFNGFVGEFLIYLGGFNGVAIESSTFIMGILAIVSLAVIGGLALACFTKVIGIVFQGEPRTRAAEKAHEKGFTMMFSMSALALVCVVIGVFPGSVIHLPLKAVQALGLGFEPRLFEPVTKISENLSFAAIVFLGMFVLVMLTRSFFYRKKNISASGTWGCGFTKPTAKMQYTGSSYASFILDFFRPVAPLSEEHPAIQGRFPLKTHYKSHISDIAGLHMNRLAVDPILFVFEKLRWIQHGDIHLYIGYILLAIVLLLFFI
ncbi:MAG: hydrogenase [Desulfobacula sp. GWF2_41_7]|nr:MAG: hydrogenase [Desulfobacula sp. GWF2_41_7]